jgi:hypothetical protein
MEMSSLAKVESKALSPELSESESMIVRHSQGVKVLKSKKSDLAKLVADIIDSSLITLGFLKTKYVTDERNIIENEILKDIISKFSFLTFEEIKEAVRLGCRGEFKASPDEVIIFSVATVYRWLKSYSDTLRREALKKQARFEQDNVKKKEPTEEEKEKFEREFFWNCIIEPYKKYLETDEYTFDNRGNVIYNKLDKFGLIPFTTERKKEFIEQAKERVKATLVATITTDNLRKLREVEENRSEGYSLVKSEAKDIALRAFFKELKDQGMDLEEYIEMRK